MPARRQANSCAEGNCGCRSIVTDAFLLTRCAPERRLDQRAFRLGAVGASGNHVLEHLLYADKVCDLRPYVTEVHGSDRARIGARLVAFIDEMNSLRIS